LDRTPWNLCQQMLGRVVLADFLDYQMCLVMTKHHWAEEFHVYGIVTTVEDHGLAQAEYDPETDLSNAVSPDECPACQKEVNGRPQNPIKGFDYETEPVDISLLFTSAG